MLEFSAGIPRCRNITDLLHFKGSFESDREVGLSPHEEEVSRRDIFRRDMRDFLIEFQYSRHEFRKALQAPNDIHPLGMRKIANSTKQQTQHRECDDLGRECFGSRDPDFQPRPQADAAFAFSSDRADDIIANTQRWSTFALALTEGRDGISRLSALTHSKNSGS